MKYPLGIGCATAALTISFSLCGEFPHGTAAAHETGAAHVHFQQPQKDAPRAPANGQLQFRSVREAKTTEPPVGASVPSPSPRRPAAAEKYASTPATTQAQVPAPAQSSSGRKEALRPAVASPAEGRGAARAEMPEKGSSAQSDSQVRPAYLDPLPGATDEGLVRAVSTSDARRAPPTSARREGDGAAARKTMPNPAVEEPQSYDAGLRPATYHGRIVPTGRPIYASGSNLEDPACGLAAPTCGLAEPDCGIYEPGCALVEPGCAAPTVCGCGEPTCGICEPGCNLVDPSCGCVEGCGDGVYCGSCVGDGSDYWCFPVCIPRFKDLSIWGGVHGFKGPRDSLLLGGPADGNFGFQEGIQLGGRAPFIGLIFPELSYQLGYQAVQSRLSGTSGPAPSGSTNERTQHFITGGFFRRVRSGVQGGVVWDMMRDDLVTSQDFHQVRYEVSLKSPLGRELGFMGIHHANNQLVNSIDYQSVDQYALFFRCHFRNGSECRLWGGGTNDSEGLFGGDFYVPFNNRWSLQSGFNYLITDQNAGPIGAREESWNVGMNLVWHFGRSAKQAQASPHRPLFQVADNGSMFIDQIP